MSTKHSKRYMAHFKFQVVMEAIKGEKVLVSWPGVIMFIPSPFCGGRKNLWRGGLRYSPRRQRFMTMREEYAN